MESNAHTPTGPVLHDDPRTRAAFATTKTGVTLYGALTAAAFLAVVVVASTGHVVNPFMWIRAILLPFITVLLHRLTVSASQGSRRAFERLRGLSAVFPIAVTGVDLIPGVCPLWYAVMQTVCMLPVIRIAFTTRGSALRAAFPAKR
ncbi:hypothetical protein [Streptomyces sp. NPDC097981]|uniref:hypothetical protein n=1 Tax=Streptomyces sp. NPDC097981 TaxID=3155428 RepID=UPI00331E4362